MQNVHAGPSFRARLLAVAVGLASLAALLGCEREVTLVEPPKFFSWDPANAWRGCTGGVGGGAPQQEFVPPPPGITLEVCPNPAPAGTSNMLFRFKLDVSVPSVNLGIFDDRGRVVRKLIVDGRFGTEFFHEVNWFIQDVPPGNYRAYFRAGGLESNSDLRIDP